MTSAALVGSRKGVPVHARVDAFDLGVAIATAGVKMNSGGADTMDDLWERAYKFAGCSHNTTIILPEYGFNDRVVDNVNTFCIKDFDTSLIEEAEKLISEIHPHWPLEGFSYWAHIRNCFQVLGLDLQSPVDFLVCYAPSRGCSVTGGTRSAFELAKRFGIKRYNLISLDEKREIEKRFGVNSLKPDLSFLL